jgi:hypothetical protein
MSGALRNPGSTRSPMVDRALRPHVRGMDAIRLLKEQHQEVKGLFAELLQTDDPEERETLFQDIADTLAAHATIEEMIFYPVAYDQDRREITHAIAEHFVVKKLIAETISLSVDDPTFDASVAILEEHVVHHIEEEESDLFEMVLNRVSDIELEGMGLEMQRLFDQEMEGEPIVRILRDMKRVPM